MSNFLKGLGIKPVNTQHQSSWNYSQLNISAIIVSHCQAFYKCWYREIIYWNDNRNL